MPCPPGCVGCRVEVSGSRVESAGFVDWGFEVTTSGGALFISPASSVINLTVPPQAPEVESAPPNTTSLLSGLKIRVEGFRLGVEGVSVRVQGAGCRVKG